MSEGLKIVTVGSLHEGYLHRKTAAIGKDELQLAQEIGDKLYLALKPHFPAAGLAAPQIGNKQSGIHLQLQPGT